MPELLIEYLAAERLGPALALLAVAVILVVAKHNGRLRATGKAKR